MIAFHYLMSLVIVSALTFDQAAGLSFDGAVSDQFKTQFIVVVRDARTRQVLPNPRIDVERVKGNSEKGISSSASFWGDGICLVKLGKGNYRLRAVADGYVTQTITNIQISDGTQGSGVSGCAGSEPQGFNGTTMILGILLEPVDGRRGSDQVRTFLSDTTFYYQPEVAPEPQGGMEMLKKKIDLSPHRSKPSPAQKSRSLNVYAHVFIERDGRVVKVDVSGEAREEIRGAISKAISETKFVPARILDTAVRSQVYIPFRLSIR